VSALLPIFGGDMPWCAICQKPVEKVSAAWDPLKLWTVYTAHCHGQVERCELTDQQAALCEGLRFGVAFARELLPAPAPELGP